MHSPVSHRCYQLVRSWPEPDGLSSKGFYMDVHWIKNARGTMEWNVRPMFLDIGPNFLNPWGSEGGVCSNLPSHDAGMGFSSSVPFKGATERRHSEARLQLWVKSVASQDVRCAVHTRDTSSWESGITATTLYFAMLKIEPQTSDTQGICH